MSTPAKKTPGKTPSLLAQYDDVVRNARALCRGDEDDFVAVLRRQEEARKLWLALHEEHDRCESAVATARRENLSLETQLKQARFQIELELEKRKRAERERDALERQIGFVRELLVDKKDNSIVSEVDREKLIPVLNSTYQSPGGGSGSGSPIKRLSSAGNSAVGHSPLHLGQGGPPPSRGTPRRVLDTIDESSNSILDDDISYDKTLEDGLDEGGGGGGQPVSNVTVRQRSGRKSGRRSNKRPSAPLLEDIEVKVRKSYEGENAEPPLNSPPPRPVPEQDGFPTPRLANHRASSAILSTPSTAILSPGKSLHHPHVFVEKTIVRMEMCVPCGKRITFGKTASKCRNCRSICHPECRRLVPVPCVASGAATPKGAAGDFKGYLADFAPKERPHVPGLVVHCVNEVEARGLTEAGIYRVPGSDSLVKDLLQRYLRGKGTPNLGRVDDVNVVCSLLKHFLRQLKEPVTTYALWSTFVKASESYRAGRLSQAVNAVQEAVARLPTANRDTLAFLLLHLIRVAETPATRMPVHNLAKVFGPTLVGYSSPEPEALQMLNEPRMQADVLEMLMAGIGPAFWEGIVRADDASWMSYDGAAVEGGGFAAGRGGVPPPSYDAVVKTPSRRRSIRGDGAPLYLKVHSASPVFQ